MQSAAQIAAELARKGRAHHADGRLEEARAAFLPVLDLYPAHAATLHALGTVDYERGHPNDARHWFERAAQAATDDRLRALATHGIGQAKLACGDWSGFVELDAWRETPEAQTLPADLPWPRWDGGDLAAKTLLVWPEEGYGDQIMYARFAQPWLGPDAKLIWVSPKPLERVFKFSLGVAVEPIGSVRSLAADAVIPSSQFGALCMSRRSAPPDWPYLGKPPRAETNGARIGVKAFTNPQHWNAARKALPRELFNRLLDIPGARSLEHDDVGGDFYDTAQIIAGLDLVITVDTALAHLAGAMGKPVWVLLPFAPDWRWQFQRTDSPWYRTARLFRQPSPGDWNAVVDQVMAALPSPYTACK